jgi:purine-binding chemotaxis protein CheW
MSGQAVAISTQYLRFQLAGESYAFDVLKAREVLFMLKITPLPTSLDFLAGVINLRGSVIPIVDLRKKFHLIESPFTEETAIIIVDVRLLGEEAVMGALVDGVKGVIRCDPSELEPPPRFGMKVKASMIQAIAKHDDQFVMVLDADQVFSEKELWAVQDAPEARSSEEAVL